MKISFPSSSLLVSLSSTCGLIGCLLFTFEQASMICSLKYILMHSGFIIMGTFVFAAAVRYFIIFSNKSVNFIAIPDSLLLRYVLALV